MESGLIWAATGSFLALVAVQAAVGLSRLPSLWEAGAQAVLFLTPPAALLIAWGARDAATAGRLPLLLQQRSAQAGAFTVAAALAIVSLFWFEPGGERWSGLIAFPTSHPFAEASRAGWIAAVLASATILATVGILAALQARLALRAPARLQAMERLALGLAIILVIVFSFDFSLNLEVLHYLANVGPAMHMLHGGVPLVDTFSQYGPGPVVATGLAYLVAPLTLGSAQFVVQLFDLAFFAIWLVCLYRLSSYRMAALVLGIVAIAVQLAVWDFGSGNIHVAPSILGFRHLPTLLLVLAISLLRPPARHSLLTCLATFVAALWSLETFVGTLGVYVGFLAFLNWRDRDMLRMLRDLAIVLAPVLLALSVIVAATLVAAHSWPRFDLYVSFFGVYNPFSDFWSYVASSSFFGWMLPLLVTFLVLAEAAKSAVRRYAVLAGCDGQSDTLFYRYLPMALSILPISAYFGFRSHDYTLAVALLPTVALLIAGGLPAAVQLAADRGPTAALLGIPVLFCLGSITYALLALGSPKAAYSFALQECRDHGRCTPSALAAHLNSRLQKREVLEPVGNILSDRWMGYLKPASCGTSTGCPRRERGG